MVVCPAGPTRDFARIDSAGAQEADIVLVKSIASTADGLGSVGVTADEHTHTNTHKHPGSNGFQSAVAILIHAIPMQEAHSTGTVGAIS